MIQSPNMTRVRAEWRAMYGGQGEFSLHWLWEDDSPQWYDKEERRRTIIMTIAAMMDPTEEVSYILTRMNRWESYLNEVQEQLLREATESTRETQVRWVIQYLHLMEGRGPTLTDVKGRTRRLWEIVQEAIAEVRQAARERGVKVKPLGRDHDREEME
jgi:predicted transcriptional regulator